MRRPLLPIVWSLLGAAVIGLLVYGLSAQSTNRTLDEAVSRHQWPKAPEAARQLPALTPRARHSLAAYRGKVVILNFWASWCKPCEDEAPMLERAQPQLERHDATVLGVTYEDTTSDSLEFVHDFKLTYPSLRDVTGSFVHAFGTDLLPESFVINRSGHIEEIRRGEVNEAFINFALKLAERS